MALTFTAMTYNLWGDRDAKRRAPAVRALFERRPPDLLGTQELRPWTTALLDQVMPRHQRVHDDAADWSHESNLWWDGDVFTEVDHGAEDVGMTHPLSKLAWVRLAPVGTDATFLFATAHLTWAGDPTEVETGINLRTPQAQRIAEFLTELGPDEPSIFLGDLNDNGRPLRKLADGGWVDSFSALGRSSPPTSPQIPRPFADFPTDEGQLHPSPRAIDWIFHRGALRCRCAEVVEFYHDASAPSDHLPVVATYTLPGVSAGRVAR